MISPLRRLLVLFDGRRSEGEDVLESFGVMDSQGGTYFVQANRVGMDEAGRLIFRAGAGIDGTIVAVVAAGEWKRILKGITLDDVKAARGESDASRG